MLSNTLAAAVELIDRYTANPDLRDCCSEPKLADQIKSVREAMDNLRSAIDFGPASALEEMARIAGKDIVSSRKG